MGCGGGSNTPAPPSAQPLTVQLGASTVRVGQDGTSAALDVTVTRPTGAAGAVRLSATGVPSGVNVTFTDPGLTNTGKVTLASQSTAAGTYNVLIFASDGVSSGSAPLAIVVAVVAKVQPASPAKLHFFMSTSFQPANWSYRIFQDHPNAASLLDQLQPQHVRIQAVYDGIPATSATTWNFNTLDAILQPVLGVADHSPEFQVVIPSYMLDSTGKPRDPTYQEYAAYAANLVRYYNKGGFTANGSLLRSPANIPIQWWGIFNEPNINSVNAASYTQLYNLTVPVMQGVDPTLRFAAVELADFGNEPQNFLPTFVAGVTAKVDALATHYYGSCNQKDSDQQVFAAVATFVAHVRYIRSALQANPALAGVPVWVTENNVNADFAGANGQSVCNPGTPFVTDARGSSAFFAAWRPYVLSQLAQAGAQALYHWDFNADVQYGEIDGSAKVLLSYWVDYWLSRSFSVLPDPDILTVSATETSTTEVFAMRRATGAVLIMVVDRAIANAADNNGPGAPRTVTLDLASLGLFTSASLLTIDASTNLTTGPVATAVPPAQRMDVTLNGYGVAFVTLTP